jgi:hypothetical protein
MATWLNWHIPIRWAPATTEEDAREFVRGLEDKVVIVQYNPAKPATSTLAETALRELQSARPPVPADLYVDPQRTIPSWAMPFLCFFAGLALLGFFLSLYVHVGSILGQKITYMAWGLHIGIFVVWFPAVLVAQRRVKNTRRKDFWKIALKGAPEWMRYCIYLFLGYAVFNFAIFLLIGPLKNSGKAPIAGAVEFRGFSGHWMAFYSAAFGLLYAAALKPGPKCINGHMMASEDVTCSICGQPAVLKP